MNRSLLKRALGLGVALGALLSGPWAVAAEGIGGAGSSAAAPVFRIWAQEYRKAGGDALEYDPVGSGTGLARIKQRNTDFGAVDVMVPKNELARDGLVMFPTAVSGVVPVVNLRRLGGALKLNGEVLARIFLGEITVWNAAEIAALNPGLALPKDPIRVVCRSDVSGTTHHLADYLSKVSPAWKARFGVVGRPAWPAGFTAVKGSSEVSQAVRNTPGAIGYVGLAFIEGVKTVTVAGVEATPETVLAKDYPIARPLYMYTNGRPKAGSTLAEYTGLADTAEGKQIIADTGFVPLP